MDSARDFLLRGNIKLPSPPRIALRLLEATKKDNFSFTEIAAIIQYDPALTAKVLKVVNSAFYALAHKVSSIEHALAIIGIHAVKNIAFSFNLIDGLKKSASDNFDIDYFWKRSVITAIGTEIFAGHLHVKDDDLFVTALLQDLGILIFNSSYIAEYSKLIEEKNLTKVPIDVLEARTFGFSHQELCSEVLAQWGLPENIYVPIRYHHDYVKAPAEYCQTARILFLSSALSSIYSGIGSYEKIKMFSSIIKNDLGISDDILEPLVDSAVMELVEICSSFDMPAADIKPLAILLQEANEALSELNYSYEKLLDEHKKLSQELKEAASLDHLTGIYNRRHLMDFLENEIRLMARYGKIFSIMIFDVDFFKKVNDIYGHQIGDFVLKELTSTAGKAKRNTDLLARYGGEEFVIVMPQTELQGATMIAERLRHAIEEMNICINSHALKVTVSIGVATCEPDWEGATVAKLFDVADKALFSAKESGRNRVVIGSWRAIFPA